MFFVLCPKLLKVLFQRVINFNSKKGSDVPISDLVLDRVLIKKVKTLVLASNMVEVRRVVDSSSHSALRFDL